MALTRKLLRSMGIDDDKVDQIIEAHTETVDGLKDERDRLKDERDKLEEEAAQVAALKATIREYEEAPADEYKAKYEQEHSDFEAFKTKTAEEAATREKQGLYRQLLIKAGIDPKRVDSVMRVSDLSEVSVEDGAIVDADSLAEKARTEWADFVQTSSAKSAKPDTPPAGGEGSPEPKNLAEALKQKYVSTAD